MEMIRNMARTAAAVGVAVLGAAALTACGGTTQTEPTPARVTVTAAPASAPAAETPAETAQWPTVDQTWQPSGEGDGEGAEPADESNCGLTCPDAPSEPDWTTVPAPGEPVATGPAMPDTTETPEVEGGDAYVAE